MWCKFPVVKLIVITFIVLFSGCHDIPDITTKHLKPGIMLSSFQNESFTYVLPSSFTDIDWYYFLDEKNGRNVFERNLPSMFNEEFQINTYRYKERNMSRSKLEIRKDREESIDRSIYDILMGWQPYEKGFFTYIDGIKCEADFLISSITQIGSANYGIDCLYYDTSGAVSTLVIGGTFRLFFDPVKHKNYKAEDMAILFKNDMSEFLKSIKLKNMDRERMKKEGLLFDRIYNPRDEFDEIIYEWFDPNKFDCTKYQKEYQICKKSHLWKEIRKNKKFFDEKYYETERKIRG